jgi:hypothetical protein
MFLKKSMLWFHVFLHNFLNVYKLLLFASYNVGLLKNWS